MGLFYNYKDIFFACYCIIWFVLDMLLWLVWDFTVDDIILVNMGMIFIFYIITVVKMSSKRFYNWLHTPLKKKGKL